MRNQIGFGIIGCGAIGDIHAKSINNTDGAKLIAVSDIDLEKAKKYSQKYNVKYYQDYKNYWSVKILMLLISVYPVVCICSLVLMQL